MKILVTTVLFMFTIIFAGGIARADLNDSFNKISDTLCKKSIQEKGKKKEYKSLKIAGTKVEGLCMLTAKTALSNCTADALKIYQGSLSSKEKDRLSKLTKSSLQFCSDYADVTSIEIVNIILDKAVSDKISVDEAAVKIAEDAAK